MTQNEIEELKELIGNNCEWNDICAVGPLLDLLQDEKNSRERLMEQNKSLARQYVSMRQRAEQAEAHMKRMEDALEFIAGYRTSGLDGSDAVTLIYRAKAALEEKP